MMRKSLVWLQLTRRDHRIVIPASLTSSPTPRHGDMSSSGSRWGVGMDDPRVNTPSLEIANLVGDAGASELKSRTQLHQFRAAVGKQNETIWKDSKSHLRRQEALVDKFGIEGAVRETLQPSSVSFTKEIMSRPLDRKILEEIYRGLHGRRVERKLKRGVSWEHWIAKGDGTAPVFNTAAKTQQAFGYGGKLVHVVSAKHEQQFPTRMPPLSTRGHQQTSSTYAANSSGSQHAEVPEVAFIGRTNSGKSSLINALVNSFVCPYGHLQGTTTSCNFYSAAGKLMIVDMPGYGYYNPLSASQLDAENAIRVLKKYITHCSSADMSYPSSSPEGHHQDHSSKIPHQPSRNIKRVFVCISSRGMQHLDIQYIELLERNMIPFSVVLTKTDRAPIRFLARLADFTRCQLVHYKHCKELFLVSSLRLAGIDKVQDLIASVALSKAPGEEDIDMQFDHIV
jgi:GTP-binding protein EngB required for normal cell division